VIYSGVFYYLLDFTIHYSKFTIPPQAAGWVFITCSSTQIDTDG